MIILSPEHKILEETIRERFNEPSDKREHVDVRLADFDDVVYHVHSDPENKAKLTVSMSYACMGELKKHGADKVIQEKFGNNVTATEPGFDLSILFDLDAEKDKADAIIRDVATLKRDLLSAPIRKVIDAMPNAGSEVISIPYRAQEALYVLQSKENVVVIFGMTFKDPGDLVVAQVFLKEFAEARRDASLSRSPWVSYSPTPPQEIKAVAPQNTDLHYVSFVLFSHHYSGPAKEKSIAAIPTFRNYLHYHIKCSKAYLHMRMRKRVTNWLQVLNRAKSDVTEKEKKTMSGKTFTRK